MQKQDFTLIRGDDQAWKIRLTHQGEPLKLAPLRFDLHARDEESDELVLQLSSHTNDNSIQRLSNGIIQLNFRAELTQGQPWQRAKYDLQLIDAEGKRQTLMGGKIKLIHDQTQV